MVCVTALEEFEVIAGEVVVLGAKHDGVVVTVEMLVCTTGSGDGVVGGATRCGDSG